MTRYGLDGHSSIPGRDKENFLYSTVSKWILGPPNPYPRGTGGFFHGGKAIEA
jgi:hypothetical protein